MNTTTALTIICSHPQIDDIRHQFDRAYPRWMPHINLCFPFIDLTLFNTIKDELMTKLLTFNHFQLKFNRIGCFIQKQRVSFHLLPEDETKLQELYQQIMTLLAPIYVAKYQQFTPHLTLGQMSLNEYNQTNYDKYLTKWLNDHDGFEFKITQIDLIRRQPQTSFQSVLQIPLK